MNDSSAPRIHFVERKCIPLKIDPNVIYPRPENTPGVFLEHYDLTWPRCEGESGFMAYSIYENAKEAAATAGWGFRSYSSLETPGTAEDFGLRTIMHFPTLILFKDGVELGRYKYSTSPVKIILEWGNELLRRLEEGEG